MVSIKTPIVLLGIALALVIVFLTLRKFGVPLITDIGKATSDAFGDAGKNITDFFNSFENDGLTVEQKAKQDEAQNIFDSQVAQKKKDSIDAGFSSVEEFEKATDTNNDPLKFNPPNIIGFGFPNVNDGKGIPDTPQNRDVLDDLISGKATFNPKTNLAVFKDLGDFNLPNPFTTPEAFGEKTPEVQTVIQAPSFDRPLNLTSFVKTNPRSKTPVKSTPNITTVRGSIQSELGTEQKFEVFGRNSQNQKVRGVIRETPKKPSELRTNSKKVPTETASQRANRVFKETGKFADEGRGFEITKAEVKTRNFNFGTNKGTGSTISTSGKTSAQRLAEAKKRAEEQALQVFNSRSISNF